MEDNGAQNNSASTETFDGPVTFADIEEITESRPKKTSIDDAMGAGNEDSDEANEASASKAKKNTREAEEGGEGEDKADKKDKAANDSKEEKGEDGKSKKAEEKPKSIKVVTGKDGKEAVEIPVDGKVQVTIAGKVEEFTVQDLVNEFSGKTDYSRKYQQLDTEKKTLEKERGSFHNEKQELNDAVDKLYQLAVTESKPIDAIAMLTDLLGGDAVKIVSDLQTKMFAQFEEESKLTPEQRNLKWANQRNDLLQKKIEDNKQAEAKKTTQSEIAKRVEAVKSQYKIDDARFNDVYQTLVKSGAKEVTPEVVGQVHDSWAKMDKIDEIAKEIGVSDEKAIQSLYKNCLNLNEAQLRKVIAEVYGGKPKKKSSLEEKIEKNNGGQQAPKKQQSSSNSQELFFSDLE